MLCRGVADQALDVNTVTGSLRCCSRLIATAQVVAPQRQSVFPAWQGMQHLRDTSSGDTRLQHLDDHRGFRGRAGHGSGVGASSRRAEPS